MPMAMLLIAVPYRCGQGANFGLFFDRIISGFFPFRRSFCNERSTHVWGLFAPFSSFANNRSVSKALEEDGIFRLSPGKSVLDKVAVSSSFSFNFVSFVTLLSRVLCALCTPRSCLLIE
jgi:hypothetical protein